MKETGQTQRRDIATVILAAGKGTRMKSDLAKVLHPVCGRPMLWYPVSIAHKIGSDKIVVVIGHQADEIKNAMNDDALLYVYQKEQLGTAHAVMQTEPVLKDFDGAIIILCGDVPLLQLSTLQRLLEFHRESASDVTVLTTMPEDPYGYGRIIKDKEDRVIKIIEHRDASDKEKEISEINTGIYCVESAFLYHALAYIETNNSQGEFYLTDIFDIARRENRKARSFLLQDPHEAMGINTVEQRDEAERIMKARKSAPGEIIS